MCLAVLAYKHHPDYSLILSTNRDEFYARPTAPADWWEDHNDILAGRDIEKGGTWMGITRNGRYALVTNYREYPPEKQYTTSRGSLVTDYLKSDVTPAGYGKTLMDEGDQYDGFNLIWGDTNSLHYYSNRGPKLQEIQPGIYGLSNHLLNTPWPKLKKAKLAFASALYRSGSIDHSEMHSILQDTTPAPEEELPNTGMDKEWERALSPCFIETPNYGTRTTTTLFIAKDGTVNFNEHTHATNQKKTHSFQLSK